MSFNDIEREASDKIERSAKMDKLTIGFIADILYIKGLIYFEEFEDIMNAKEAPDLQDIVEKMLRGEYNAQRRGEGYVIE